jgi:hypothetical protein
MGKLEVVPESEQIKRLKAVAKEHFDIIINAAALTSTNSLRIGYHAYRMKEQKLFGVLGFADENEAREAAGVGESTWYANIRLAEAFKDVTEERFIKMKQANAKALADLPESKRTSTQWLRAAETDKIKKFAEKIDQEMGTKARPSDGKEPSTSWKIDMPASRKTVIEEKVKEYAQAHGIEGGDIGKVIEVMCVETTGGVTLIGSITNALQRIKNVKEVTKSGLSADEALVKVEEELDQMVLDFQAALTQASQREDVAA